MVTVATSTATTASAYANQRKVDRCQNGNLWAMFWDGTSTTTDAMEFRYSTDDGATWNAGSDFGFKGTGTTYIPNGSLFIDLDDYAHVVYKDRHDGEIYYRRGTPNAGRTAWTWSAAVALRFFSTDEDYPDVVAHREGTGWVAHAVWSYVTSNNRTRYNKITIASDGTITYDGDGFIDVGGVYDNTNDTYPSIDFNHTGDGKTVAGSTPHLYAAWSAGATGSGKGIRFRKATYSSGSWTWNTERGLDDSFFATTGRISSLFDGTRAVVAYAPSTDEAETLAIRERDAADTSTTARTPTALSDGTVEAVTVTYDNDENIHLWAVGTTSDDVKRLEFDRSAGTWDTWTTVATADARPDTLTLKRGFSSSMIEAVYTDGTESPYNVTFASLVLTTPPNAPTWNTADNQAHDVNAGLTLDWQFNDPDDGDTQSAYALRRQIGAGSLEYWTAGTTSWGASETKNTSSTSAVTLAASWGADSDANHKYAAKTWDAGDLEGTYSSELTVIPSAKDNPTLSDPAAAATIASASVVGEWSATTQTAYRARLLSSTDVQLQTSGKVTSGSTTHTFHDLDNSTTYKYEIVTWNDEGLESDADVHTFSTSFTPPPTPTLTVAEAPTGALTVDITNPTPGGGEPDVTGNRIFVRVAAGGRKDIGRPVGGDGLRIATGVAESGTYIDYAATSGTTYEYKVRAVADNGTTADSAWVA